MEIIGFSVFLFSYKIVNTGFLWGGNWFLIDVNWAWLEGYDGIRKKKLKSTLLLFENICTTQQKTKPLISSFSYLILKITLLELLTYWQPCIKLLSVCVLLTRMFLHKLTVILHLSMIKTTHFCKGTVATFTGDW